MMSVNKNTGLLKYLIISKEVVYLLSYCLWEVRLLIRFRIIYILEYIHTLFV